MTKKVKRNQVELYIRKRIIRKHGGTVPNIAFKARRVFNEMKNLIMKHPPKERAQAFEDVLLSYNGEII